MELFYFGILIFFYSIMYAFPSGLVLALLLYKRSISYGKFTLAFLGLSTVSNFFVGIIFIAFKEFYSMMILSVFQYLPVFIYSYRLSKPKITITDNIIQYNYKPTELVESRKNFYAFLQKNLIDTKEIASIDSVLNAIEELKSKDCKNERFRVGFLDGENLSLEVNSDLRFIAKLGPNDEFQGRALNWLEIEIVFRLFLNRKFEDIIKRIKNYSAQQNL